MVTIELKGTEPSRILSYTLYLVPLWWIMGFSPVVYHISVLLYFYAVARRERIVFPAPSLFLLLFMVLYAFSFSLNWVNFPLSRGLASLYNLSIWVMGFLLVVGIYIDSHFDLRGLLEAGTFLLWFTLGFFLFDYLLFLKYKMLNFPTLLGLLLPFSPSGSSLIIKLFFQVKLHIVGRGPLSFLPRVSYYSPYANAFAGTMILIWPMALTYYRGKGNVKKAHLANLVGFFLLFLSMSRASFFIGALLFFYFEFTLLSLSGSLALLAFSSLLLAGLFFLGVNPLEVFEKISYGSTETRIKQYREALKLIGAHPILGIGLKPSYLPSIPLGSHSTYIGLLQKTGLMGFLTFLAYQISLVKTFLKGKRFPYIAAGVFLMFVWMFFEDLDAPALVAFLFFSLNGVLIKYNLKGGNDGGN